MVMNLLFNLLFFYLGGSFMVAMYWLMDEIDGTNIGKGNSHIVLMVLWPIVVFVYIINKKLGSEDESKRG